MVDLVGDEPDPLIVAIAHQVRQGLRRHHGTGRIGRACDKDAFDGTVLASRLDVFRRQRPAAFRPDFDFDRNQAQSLQDIPIGRITRRGQQNPVSRVEGGEEDQVEPG